MEDRARLFILGPTPPPFHGVAVAVQTLLQSDLGKRFRTYHLDLADRRGIQHVNKPDLHDVVLFARQWLKLVSMLINACPAVSYLVLSQSTIGFLRDSLLIWPAYLRGSHVVLHLHGGNFRDWFLGRSWLMKAYVKAVLRRVTRAIVLGESLKRQFEGLVDEQRIAVVPNGVDWGASSLHSGMPRGGSRFRILHLSTLSHLKGALMFLRAVPSVVQQRKDVEFVLAGPWSHAEDKQWADSFICQHKLETYVSFSGQVDGAEKRALFDSSDIFVFPGVQQEGQPLVVLEAMAAGIPVIFTDRGCLRDTVPDGEVGLEVPIGDPRQLADRILWLLDHPEAIKAMGARARKRYEALYTKERHIERMMDIFISSCEEGVA
ncbi:MAG: glycosyltransferase family 4 protein [Nitrospira sp.]|nr:glycosyltransferase family 4 protein [Nitrospira sp.]